MTSALDHSSSTADGIEQEAAVWVIRMDEPNTTETASALDAWLREHPRHRAAFLRLSTGWRRADCLRTLARHGDEPDPDLLVDGVPDLRLRPTS